MNKIKNGALLIILSILFSSCGKNVVKPSVPIKKVAVVQFSVSDYGGMVEAQGLGSESGAVLMQSQLNQLLIETEKSMAKLWSVKNSDGFASNSKYLSISIENPHHNVYVPYKGNGAMPIFMSHSDLKQGMVPPQVAMDICDALGVDAIVFVFSEWALKTGGFIPTTKALTKNVFSMWDKNGNLIAWQRANKMGQRTLGVGRLVFVNRDTIGQWSDAYLEALDMILANPEIQSIQ
ncbi:MAG: hypothetical protein OEZ13_09595 [Spirochaetia bacterium]|nr:hypothetical protein [Spirochaetia bacterium]